MAAAAPQILTTPTKGYNLRNRLVPLSSPEHLNGQAEDMDVDDIQSEPPPPEMNELACEALTEELKQMQVLTKILTFKFVLSFVLQFQSSILGLPPTEDVSSRLVIHLSHVDLSRLY